MLLQDAQALGAGQELKLGEIWEAGGFMMWPLGFCLVVGILIITWKFIDLVMKSLGNKRLLSEVDGMIAQQRLDQALALCEESTAPAGEILAAGLKRYREGTERVTQAVENAGAIEVSKLERGLVWLATLSNVAPLLGFLGLAVAAAGVADAALGRAQALGKHTEGRVCVVDLALGTRTWHSESELAALDEAAEIVSKVLNPVAGRDQSRRPKSSGSGDQSRGHNHSGSTELPGDDPGQAGSNGTA